MFLRLAPAFAGYSLDLTLQVKLARVIRDTARFKAPRLPRRPKIEHLYQPDAEEQLEGLRTRLRGHLPPF